LVPEHTKSTILYREQKKGHFQMNNIVRAWKDAAYRQSLSAEEQAMLPANPAGEIELTDAELETLFGATGRKQGKPSLEQEIEQEKQDTHVSQIGLVNLEQTDISALDILNIASPHTVTQCNGSQSAENEIGG
jgi:mersacidin/lichenicidin family type 2 lantibiotic